VTDTTTDPRLTAKEHKLKGRDAGEKTDEGRIGLPTAIPVKQKKTAEELAAMIHQDLSQLKGCPKRGVNVTVYGLNPWNSLLMFGVDAGPVPNKADLHGFCDIITERLKRLYDV
jgi:hypothetical protein